MRPSSPLRPGTARTRLLVLHGPGLRQATAQFEEHPPHNGPAQAHVGEGVLSHGRYALRPFEQSAKEVSPRGVQPLQHRVRSLLAPRDSPHLALVGILSLALEIELERV